MIGENNLVAGGADIDGENGAGVERKPTGARRRKRERAHAAVAARKTATMVNRTSIAIVHLYDNRPPVVTCDWGLRP